jgi:3-oxoacyl-[acyl-carrier-protein] synthase III
MKNLFKAAVVGAAVVTSGVVMAQPAMASDLSWTFGDGAVSYRDSGNDLCARAYDSEGARQVKVLWTPHTTQRTSTFIDKNNYYGDSGGSCWDMAGTGENVTVTVTVSSYWGERGWKNHGSRTITT